GLYRRGEVVPMKETADAAADAAPSVDAVVVVERVGRAYAKRGRDVPWSELRHRADLDIADTSAEDPFMVIYTSGTTGKPKGALHVHGGFPVKAAQDLAHCFDLQERDVILWSTDIGWMMGPWLIAGGLMLARRSCCTTGLPIIPTPHGCGRWWSAIGLRISASRRPRSGVSCAQARLQSARRTVPRSLFSARPVSHGIRIPGGGTSATSARSVARSSTTPAAPKSPAASS